MFILEGRQSRPLCYGAYEMWRCCRGRPSSAVTGATLARLDAVEGMELYGAETEGRRQPAPRQDLYPGGARGAAGLAGRSKKR
jgi:hypothetical protein